MVILIGYFTNFKINVTWHMPIPAETKLNLWIFGK